MTNDELYEKAMESITVLFSDQSVSQNKCEENLRSLICEIEQLIDTLDLDF